MKKVVFFDVETNNPHHDRICQFAMIYEEDDKEVFSKSWYINPESPFYGKPVSIHGITSEMVKDAPIFPEVWKEIHEYFEQSLVIGHNVSFDRSVLDKVFQYYDIYEEAFTFADTKKKAAQMPNHPDSLGLGPLCSYYGIELAEHHDAMCDAKACRDLYHLFDQFVKWDAFDEETYWFGKATLKTTSKELASSLLDLDGIIFGILSDGRKDSYEFSAIENWCKEHEHLRKCYGFEWIFPIVDRMLSDRVIDLKDSHLIHRIAEIFQEDAGDRKMVALQTLRGIINGILSDGTIEQGEILSLQTWMDQNEQLSGTYPFDTIFETVDKVMSDGVITVEEQTELTAIFSKFVDPVKEVKPNCDISIDGKTCCLSGNFKYGQKQDVEKRVIELGGIVASGVTKKTDILIVGDEGSSSWAYGNYGTKVKKALKMQNEGHHIVIVSETQVL